MLAFPVELLATWGIELEGIRFNNFANRLGSHTNWVRLLHIRLRRRSGHNASRDLATEAGVCPRLSPPSLSREPVPVPIMTGAGVRRVKAWVRHKKLPVLTGPPPHRSRCLSP